MLAIGNGAEQEILEQMKLLGANNIVITPIIEQKEGKVDSDPNAKKTSKRFTPGLSYLDAEAIRRTIPDVGSTSSEVVINSVITREGRHRSGKLVGVDSSYFGVMNLTSTRARFHARTSTARPVAIIGQGVKYLLHDEDPSAAARVHRWLTVVGVSRTARCRAKPRSAWGFATRTGCLCPLPTMPLRYRTAAK